MAIPLRLLISLSLIIFIINTELLAQPCDNTTPSFSFDLTGKPDGAWTSPNTNRVGLCCGLDPLASPPIRCVEFIFTLDTNAQGIRFEIASGAIPPGALGYQIECGEYYMVGDNICLDGPGPHRLTFCKPGNNKNTYTITSIPKPRVSPPVAVSDGCTGVLFATGFDESTIRWSSVPSDPVHESYLNCLTCDTVYATMQPGAPPYVDYQVTGSPIGGCEGRVYTRTTRIYFYNDKAAVIEPQDPVICYGGSNATLTVNATGGAPPYTYIWSTGETSQTISAGVGTYWVRVQDTTSCPMSGDTVVVTSYLSPTVANAGPDVSSCANSADVTLTGSVESATGGIWTGGAGTYSPDNTSLTATYTPTAAEINAGIVRHVLTTTGTGDCPPRSDTTIHLITPAPTINAGPDISICANNTQAQLNGSVTTATGGTWSEGTGTYTPGPNSLNAVYIPSVAEISSGSVTLTLTSTGNGGCLPVTDNILITITPAPTVDAGPDVTVCGNNANVQLNGSVTIATGGSWIGGSGTFSPGRNSLTATYTPSATEISAGSVNLQLATTGNGNCIAESDQMVITITPAPTINAGPDIGVCSNNPVNINLSATVTVASGVSWTGGSGTFNPDRNSQSASYTPTATEISDGSVTFTATSTGNGSCIAVSDQLVLSFSPPPTVNAGPDSDVCANNSTISLNGSVTGATGGQWTGGNGTFNPGRNSLAATYIPTLSEIAAGTITFTLTTTGNGNCLPLSDMVTYAITPAPTVNAGPDFTFCGTAPTANLNGTVTVATGGSWSGGSGTFNPGANQVTTDYTPTPGEINLGSVTLTLTSTGNGKCIPVRDRVNIYYKTDLPVVNAGTDQELCGDVDSISLNGTFMNAGGVQWSTTGSGLFSPSNTLPGTFYIPTAADKSAGTLNFTLTTTGSFPCPEVSSSVAVTFTAVPFIEAGPDQSVCANTITEIQFSATGNPGRWTGGTGTFLPNDSTLNARYKPDPSEAGTTVKFVITTISNTACPSVKDSLNVTFLPGPEVTVGPDFQVCADTAFVSLSATVAVATQVQWTTNGTGTLISPATLATDYIPSQADTTAGRVRFTATTVDNGLCPAVSDEVEVTIIPAPVLNAGNDITICGNEGSVPLNGSINNASAVRWTSTGTGTFNTDAFRLNPDYLVTGSDTAQGSLFLIMESTDHGMCKPVADSLVLTFTPLPYAIAGNDVVVCANNATVNLSGAVYNTTGGTWSSTGSGTFSGAGLSTVYTPSSADTIAKNLVLTLTAFSNSLCPESEDALNLTITPAPLVNAGPDITICSIDDAQLSGSVTVSGTGTWTGNGIFTPDPNDLNAIYAPALSELNAEYAQLTLTSTNNGNCLPVTDQISIFIIPTPAANAGPDVSLCKNEESVNLNGSLTNSNGGIWTTSGSGVFIPSANTEVTSYRFSSADKTGNSVQFILSASGLSSCPPRNDTVLVTLVEIPEVDAGSGTVCADFTGATLTATLTNTAGITWTTLGSGTFSPNTTSNPITYNPSSADLTAGTVNIRMETNPNGPCAGAVDTVLVAFAPVPTAYAGADITVCADSSYVVLTGSATDYTSVSWNSTSFGNFSPAASLNTNYVLTSADISNSAANVILTVYGNPLCEPVTDTAIISITPAPTVTVGNDSTVCPNLGGIFTLKGAVTVASGGVWSSTGTGGFIPTNAALTTYYQFSQEDYLTGEVIFTMTSTGNGTCKPTSATRQVTVLPVPIVSAGEAQTVCRDAIAVAFTGQVQVANGLKWSTGGTGTFAPTDIADVVYYYPSESDKNSGSVPLYLNSTGNFCKVAVDSVLLNFIDAPTVDGGPDRILCIQEPEVQLNGVATNSPGVRWNTSGSGVFLPNNLNISPSYQFSVQDTILKTITLAITSVGNDACYAEDSVRITLYPAPNNNFHDIPLCEGFWATLSTIPEGFEDLPRSNIEWRKNNILLPDTVMQIHVNDGGSYTVNYTVGGCTVSDTSVVTVNPSPVSNMQNDYLYCQELDKYEILNAGDGVTYLWETTLDQTKEIIVTEPGYYPVRIYNEFGCYVRDSAYLKSACPPRVFPTNAFTPNGDGKNDFFKIPGAYTDGFSITIFNRWGEIIFYSEKQEPGWDGNYMGEPMLPGVYPYMIRYHASDEEYYEGEKVIKGSITLIR